MIPHMPENIPSFSQAQIRGKVSWFGGPHDPSAGPNTASNAPVSEPGIAVYNRHTLGGYWKVTANNGRSAILKQTDLGPAPWTGRKIDVTYSALGHFGYNEGNFPTDSTFSAQYLGNNPRAAQAGGVAQNVAQERIRIPGTPGTPERLETGFNKEAFQKARQTAQNNRLLLSLAGGKELKGLLGTTAPKVSEYLSQTKVPGTPGSPGREILRGPGTSGNVPQGHELHGLLPAGAHVLEWKRKDQGHDVQLRPGQVLLATGNGVVVRNGNDPSGFGPSYPIIHWTSGPEAGKDTYYGHTDSLVKPGQRVRAGQTVARTSKTGHNAPPGWLEYGYAPGGTPGPFGQQTPF